MNNINNIEYENALNNVIKILENKAILEEYKADEAERFCQTYIYFDSSRFNKYF